MKVHQEQGINTTNEKDFVNKNSKIFSQNEQQISKQPELIQIGQQQLNNNTKDKDQKPFSSFVMHKYSQMNDKDFKKIPISFIKQIYDNHSIDLRKVNKESINSKLNSTHKPIDFSRLQMSQSQTQQNPFDKKHNIFHNNQTIQQQPNQYNHMVQSSYNYQINSYLDRNKQSSEATNQFESFNSGINSNTSYLNSPLNIPSNVESRSSSQKYNTRYDKDSDSVIQENNHSQEIQSTAKTQKNKSQGQFSKSQYVDNQNIWKQRGQQSPQSFTNKIQKFPITKSLKTSPSKYEQAEMKYVNSFNELGILQSSKIQSPVIQSIKGSQESFRGITSLIKNNDCQKSNSSKSIKNTQLKQISHVKNKSDFIQNAFSDQAFNIKQEFNQPDQKVLNRQHTQTYSLHSVNSISQRQKAERNDINQINGYNGLFKRANSNTSKDETEQRQLKQSQQNYFFTGDFKNNSTRQTSYNSKPNLFYINTSLSHRQNEQSNQKLNTNNSIKNSGNSVRFHTENEEDIYWKDNFTPNNQQQLFSNKIKKTQDNINKNMTQSVNKVFIIKENEKNQININKNQLNMIENIKSMNQNQNISRLTLDNDNENEKFINSQQRTSQEQNASNQNGFMRKSFRLTDISKSAVLQTTKQDQKNTQKINELNSPLSQLNKIQQNIVSPKMEKKDNNKLTGDNELQQAQDSLENSMKRKQEQGDSEIKDLKILESKFVLHKPLNHTKNKEYIKNLQSYKNSPLATQTNGEQSPFVRENKKRLSLSFLQPHQLLDNQKRDQLHALASPTSLCSATKVKSLFSKSQSSQTNLNKLDVDDLQLEKSKSRKSSNVFKNKEKESMLSSQKGKQSTDEIKTSLVRQILSQQNRMYEENQMSIEHKLFEKRKQENQINLKNNSNMVSQQQNEFNLPSHRTSKLMFQELLSPSSPFNQKLFDKKQLDLSPSYSKDVVSPKGNNTPNGNKGYYNMSSPKTLAEKFSQEENLMIRRSSMRLSINIPQNHLNNIQIQEFSEVFDKDKNANQNLSQQNSKNYNDQSNNGINVEKITPSLQKRSDLPTIAVQISNRNIDEIPSGSKRNSKINNEQNLSKRNSLFINDSNSPQHVTNEDSNTHININTGYKQQASMFSKMLSIQSNSMNRRPSKIVIIESQTSIKDSKKNKNNSDSSQDSIESDSSEHSRNSGVNGANNNKNSKKNTSMNIKNSSHKINAISNFDINNTRNNDIQSNLSIQSIANTLCKNQTQGFGFSESVKTFYEKQSEDHINISQKDFVPNMHSGIHQLSNIQKITVTGTSGGTSTSIQSPRYSNTLILNSDQRKSDQYSKFQNFEQKRSNNSPRNLNSPRNQNSPRSQNSPSNQNSHIRIPLSGSDQSSKQKGFATISIELKEIMEPFILKKVSESDKLVPLLKQYSIKLEELKNYYKLFLEYALIEDYKVFNMDLFAPFKMHYTIFQQLQILLIDTLKSLNYNAHAIEQIIEKLEGQKKVISEGLLVNEIGGTSGVHKLVVESFDEINSRIPNSFAHGSNSEEKITILTRVVTIICNFERLFSSDSNTCMNQIDQKSVHNTEIQPLLHYFKDFGQMEFYCLKIIFWTSLQQRGYRQQTILRFLEQFEKARHKIASTLTMNSLLSDKLMYEELVSDYHWKIQYDQQLSSVFEDNSELILNFCHSNILEFLYNLQGRFDLHFLLTKLPQLTSANLNKLKNILIDLIKYREINIVHVEDIKLKFFKLSCRLGLDQSPLSKLSQNQQFLQKLVDEIDFIMHSDECFESFIQKFPEDRMSLTLGDKQQSSFAQSGLRALNFFLLTLLSDSDIYSIHDLRSQLQTFNISITIPIQWKIAIEFSLNNLKVPSQISKEIVDIISNQFSLLYKNTQYESFNNVLLN